MKDNFTPERLRVLRLCDKPNGHRPLAEDWQAAYWLYERGLVIKNVVRSGARYTITTAGKDALAAADTPVAADCPTCHGKREITVAKPTVTRIPFTDQWVDDTTTVPCPACTTTTTDAPERPGGA